MWWRLGMHPNACMRESMAEARSVCLSVAARLTRFAGRAWRPWCTKGSGERGEGSKWWGVGGREGQARRNGSFWSHRWLGLVCRGGPSVGRVHCGMQACRPTMVHMQDEKREEGASWVGQREVGCSVVRAGGRRRARGGTRRTSCWLMQLRRVHRCRRPSGVVQAWSRGRQPPRLTGAAPLRNGVREAAPVAQAGSAHCSGVAGEAAAAAASASEPALPGRLPNEAPPAGLLPAVLLARSAAAAGGSAAGGGGTAALAWLAAVAAGCTCRLEPLCCW